MNLEFKLADLLHRELGAMDYRQFISGSRKFVSAESVGKIRQLLADPDVRKLSFTECPVEHKTGYQIDLGIKNRVFLYITFDVRSGKYSLEIYKHKINYVKMKDADDGKKGQKVDS